METLRVVPVSRPQFRRAPVTSDQPVTSQWRRPATLGSDSAEHLLDVKRLADSLGGAEHVRLALETLEQLR